MQLSAEENNCLTLFLFLLVMSLEMIAIAAYSIFSIYFMKVISIGADEL